MSHAKKPLSLRQPALYAGTALAVAGSLLAPQAYAAGETRTLDEVVVEASEIKEGPVNPHAAPGAPYKIETLASPKYTRPIADTPKTITVIGKEAIADSGATDLSDVMRAQPGVTISTGEGGNAFGDRYIIRGFEARNDVFVDSLRDPGVTTRDVFAVEQIEVSKGPSATFAGRGTSGGAINLVTKKATFDDEFTRTEVGLGTDNKQRYTVDNNTILTDDLALRTNLLYSDRDVPARDGVEEQRQGAAVALEWWASDAFKVNADYYYHETDDVPDGGVPWDAVTGKPVKGRHFYGQNGRDYWQASSNIGTLGLEYSFNPDLKLTNQTRHGRTTNEYVISIAELGTPTAIRGQTVVGLSSPGVFARARSQNRNQENTYNGNQTNLNWDTEIGGMKHSFVFGTEVSREEARNLPYSDSVRNANAGDPHNPNNNAWKEAGGALMEDPSGLAELKIDTLSFYAMDTWTVNDDWELFGGLRYDMFDYSLNAGPSAYTGGTNGKVVNDEGFLNGHAGVVYSPWENGNVYISYSTSSNPTGEQIDAFTNCAYGGLCQNGTTGAFPEPEQNTSYEVGTKWEMFDDRLLLTGALFQITKEDVISSVGGGGIPATFTQVGELRVRGVEVGLSGNLTERLSGQLGVALLDTEITESDNPAEIGRPFPNTAETSANLQLRYQATQDWAFGGAVTYVGEIEGGEPNSSGTGNTLAANTRFDLMGEYAVTDQAKLRLNVLNVTDKEYYDALYRSGAPFTYVGEGRSATLSLAYEF